MMQPVDHYCMVISGSLLYLTIYLLSPTAIPPHMWPGGSVGYVDITLVIELKRSDNW